MPGGPIGPVRASVGNVGITDRVEVLAVEAAGIMDVVRPATKGIGKMLTPAAAAVSAGERKGRRQAKDRERSQRRRDETRAARVADGSYRGRGRPPKAGSSHSTGT